MIQLSRNYSLPPQEENLLIKVIGVGGAGGNALDRMVLDGLERPDLLAANTDAQALASSVAAHKVQLGRTVTRGLGAGGDPELGYNAAVEAADEAAAEPDGCPDGFRVRRVGRRDRLGRGAGARGTGARDRCDGGQFCHDAVWV